MSYATLADAWGASSAKEDCYSKAMDMVNRSRRSNIELFNQVNTDRPFMQPHPSLSGRAINDSLTELVGVKKYIDNEYRSQGIEGIIGLLPTDAIVDLQNRIRTQPFINTIKDAVTSTGAYGRQMLTLDIDDLINYAVVFLIVVLCWDGVKVIFRRLFS